MAALVGFAGGTVVVKSGSGTGRVVVRLIDVLNGALLYDRIFFSVTSNTKVESGGISGPLPRLP